jgi:hypothetical protein
MVVPQNRALAEARSAIQDGQGKRPKLPLITLHRPGTYTSPGERQHTGKIRAGGYSKDNMQNQLTRRKLQMPVPINIPYLIFVWGQTQKQADLLMETIFFSGGSGFSWFKIWVDEVWQNKYVTLAFDNQAQNLTETAQLNRVGIPLCQYALRFTLQGWMFDRNPQEVSVIRQIRIQFKNYDSRDEQYDEYIIPERRIIGEGDGIETHFTHTAGAEFAERTVVISATVSGSEVLGFDDGNGSFIGTGVSGTVTYATGEVDVTFDNPPDDDTSVELGYSQEE